MSYQLQKHLINKQDKLLIDKLMGVAAIVHPMTAVPQVYDIYSTGNVAGVSLLTWLSFMLLGIIFLLYGIIHRIKPFIITQVLWFIVDFLVVVGILIYR